MVRFLPKEESEEILGFVYFERARLSLGWEKQAFINRFEAYLLEGLCKPGERELFDFLIELASLTVSLYKWGMLLYNMDEQLYDNRILTVRTGERQCVISDPGLFDVTGRLSEGEVGLALVEIENKTIRYRPQENPKSYLLMLLLYLYRHGDSDLYVYSLEEYDARYSGSYLAFDAKRAFEQREYLKYIRAEFDRYKQRLDELQRLFYQNF
jgi:hypothetical protein